MKKSIISILLVVSMMLSLTACGSKQGASSDSDNNGYEDTVYIGMHSELDSADPYGSASAECQIATNMTHLMLTYNNSDTGVLDAIAADTWEDVDGDGVNWKVTLKQGIKFHNGEEMHAEDVKFTWEYANSDAGNCIKPLSAATYVESYEVLDDYSLIFHLKSAMFDFPTYLDTKIYSKKAFDSMDPAKAALIGSGPYKYDESLHKSGVQYGFTRFDDYYEGIENYPTLHIVVKYIPEEDARISALQAKEIDVVYFTSTSYMSVLEKDENIKTYTRKGAQSYYLGWNWYSDKVKDIKLRTALAKAINKDDITAIAFENGLGGTASNNFCVPSGLGYTEVDAIKYNPTEAKALLKELGYEKGLTLKLVHYASTKKIAEVIQSNLAAVGVNVNVEQIDDSNWGAFKSAHEGFDFFLDYCSYKGALLYNYNRFFQKNGSSNMTGYYNEEFEQLLQNVLTAQSYDDMLNEFAVMQQWVAEDVSVFPLAVNNMVGATLNDVEGYVLADTTNWMDYSTVKIPVRK